MPCTRIRHSPDSRIPQSPDSRSRSPRIRFLGYWGIRSRRRTIGLFLGGTNPTRLVKDVSGLIEDVSSGILPKTVTVANSTKPEWLMDMEEISPSSHRREVMEAKSKFYEYRMEMEMVQFGTSLLLSFHLLLTLTPPVFGMPWSIIDC
jgi:hypothetical protein